MCSNPAREGHVDPDFQFFWIFLSFKRQAVSDTKSFRPNFVRGCSPDHEIRESRSISLLVSDRQHLGGPRHRHPCKELKTD